MNALKSTLQGADAAVRTLTSSRILQQAGWLATAKVVQGLASILATLAVARHLGPSVFGELSLAIALASFVSSAAALGLEHIATRELALAESARGSSMVSVLLRLRIIGGLLGAALILAIHGLPASSRYGVSGLLLVLCLLPLAQIGDLSEWRLIAAGRSRRVAAVAVAVSPLAALARLGLALTGADVIAFAWTLVAEWALRSALLAISSHATKVVTGPTLAFLPNAITLLRDSMPLLTAGIAVFVYMRIDQFMIAAMLGPTEVGLYSAVVTLAEVPLILPALLLRASLPTLTQQSMEDPALRDRTLARLMRNAFYLHALVAAVLAVFAEPIVVLLYGEPFATGAAALRIQVLAAPFVALGVLSSAWLVLQRCTSHALRRTVIGALINVALNLWLIPHYGIAGAAIATLVAQVLATYAADAFYLETRALFMMKTRALLPWRGSA